MAVPSTLPAVDPPVGLALAGGAAGGAIYEIGAMRALDEAIDGIDLHQLGVYVGVSAGAFLGSCLANGLSTEQMCRAITKPEPGEHPFVPELFFQPAVQEMRGRLLRVPRQLGRALLDYVSGRERRLVDALTNLGQTLPVGLFANEPVRDYVRRIFAIKGRTDDFRRLQRRLVVVATELETGRAVRFGLPGFDHVPISNAVQASTALPGLYPPVKIDGRYHVDGVLLKTMHASVALDAGARLVFCINPIVPVDARPAIEAGLMREGQMVDHGLVSVMSQTLRTLIHSRMTLGLRAYKTRFPEADVVLIEPRRDDYEYFYSNIFTFSSRRAVAQRAYQATRAHLLARREELAPVLARHGLRLNVAALEEPRDLWKQVSLPDDDLTAVPPTRRERWRKTIKTAAVQTAHAVERAPAARSAAAALDGSRRAVLDDLDRVLARLEDAVDGLEARQAARDDAAADDDASWASANDNGAGRASGDRGDAAPPTDADAASDDEGWASRALRATVATFGASGLML
ncbi:MAG: patatin-like phospholipase family protein [Acidobacteriota bacterium]